MAESYGDEEEQEDVPIINPNTLLDYSDVGH